MSIELVWVAVGLVVLGCAVAVVVRHRRRRRARAEVDAILARMRAEFQAAHAEMGKAMVAPMQELTRCFAEGAERLGRVARGYRPDGG